MFETMTNPWDVVEHPFPAHSSPSIQWRFLLNYALLAPSGHNTQPWRFTVHDDVVEMYADRTRHLPVVDPQDRALIISCGAAVFHLRLALWHYGYHDDVELCPDPHQPDLLACVRRGETRIATGEEHDLFWVMQRRHTYRGLFADRPVPASVRTDVQLAALEEGAWLQVAHDHEHTTLAQLVAAGDHIQWADPAFRNELAR
jgi:hypothetical protein